MAPASAPAPRRRAPASRSPHVGLPVAADAPLRRAQMSENTSSALGLKLSGSDGNAKDESVKQPNGHKVFAQKEIRLQTFPAAVDRVLEKLRMFSKNPEEMTNYVKWLRSQRTDWKEVRRPPDTPLPRHTHPVRRALGTGTAVHESRSGRHGALPETVRVSTE